MRHLLWIVASITLPACVATAQDILHYKFESGGGSTVINYASGQPGIPRQGVIVDLGAGLPVAQAWGAGRFGGGLAAAPVTPAIGWEVCTGWDHHVTGDLTVAFFYRVVHPLPTNAGGVLCGGATSREPGNGVVMSIRGIPGELGWAGFRWSNSNSRNLVLRKDLYTPALSRWVHLAINIDRTAQVARWYVDGVAEPEQALAGTWLDIPGGTNAFNVGQANQAHFALDEFRLSLRSVPAGEIQAWAQQDLAAQAPFGEACHPLGRPVLLDGTAGGAPVLGNLGYRQTVYGLPQSSVALLLGCSNQSIGAVGLPLDLGFLSPDLAGCPLRCSAELALGGAIGPAGDLTFALPVPDDPMLSGAVLYSQALLDSTILQTTMLSNALAAALGR